MKLVPNSNKVARHSFSLHLNALGFACIMLCMLETAWPFLAGYLAISPVLFAVLAGLFTGLALPARFIIQKQLSGADDAD
ncbi:hypothetical protein [Mesorhizobium sp.]|uniref:DUF7940 domain-containing protein n=1 Tax=Mesorhizobium sp. TaxID=1871066 RepID=UPI000FE9301B|nr:hypothetical protein [Mesorhizobium sp.]RWP69560.1 MAG: hypothetical protein EOR07_03275 [Mesorhizobium sp.]